jgi:hypothetical protein
VGNANRKTIHSVEAAITRYHRNSATTYTTALVKAMKRRTKRPVLRWQSKTFPPCDQKPGQRREGEKWVKQKAQLVCRVMSPSGQATTRNAKS